ncbi:MAG: hypothetical protein ACREQJ_02155 [Candidatus Binatia bacterium]
MHSFQLWLHVVASAVYLGSTAIVIFLVPFIREAAEPEERRRRFARIARAYNPIAIGSMGVAIMTGAFNLTDYKARLGPRFFAELGGVLGWKLLLVFALVMVATSLAFGIAHRTVREEEWNEPVDAAALDSRLRRVPGMLWTALAIAGAVFWLGLAMAH